MRLWLSSHTAVLMHLCAVTVLSALVCLYLGAVLNPGNGIWVEGERFSYADGEWTGIYDINFSGSSGIMSVRQASSASAAFDVGEEGRYALWVKYFGNYARTDIGYWRSVYTNEYGYLDYSGAVAPMNMTLSLDDHKPAVFSQTGSHRYRWKKAGEFDLSKGAHTVRLWKTDAASGSINLDGVLVTRDLAYAPHWMEVLPRQASEYLSPLLIVSFPLLVWVYLRRTGRRGRNAGCAAGDEEGTAAERARGAVLEEEAGKEGGSDAGRIGKGGLGKKTRWIISWIEGLSPGGSPAVIYSVFLSSVLSVMWIDTDGAFWIWLTENPAFNPSTIYTYGDALHHRYVYPPPVALLLIWLRPVFSLFGAMGGLNASSLLVSKLAVIPFAVGTALLLYRISGKTSVILWSMNSLVIFAAAANSMYFGLAFLLSLMLYFAKTERPLASALSLGAALAYMSAAALLVPPFLLLLRSAGGLRKAAIMAALALLPSVLVMLPYTFMDPVNLDHRVMGAGIATWMFMHLGVKAGNIGVTTLLYASLLAFLWIKKPRFDCENLSSSFAMASLIYLNIGAPQFLLWLSAFQPFIIIWAAKNREEVFYSLYVTAMMVWGSFHMNTGGAGDRAGETGFFPNYIFYTWPFDAYRLIRGFYAKIDYFQRADIETLTHSASAGISLVLLMMMASKMWRGEGMAADGPLKGGP